MTFTIAFDCTEAQPDELLQALQERCSSLEMPNGDTLYLQDVRVEQVGVLRDDSLPLTPLQRRIVAALRTMPQQRADWYDLGRLLWPPQTHPKAWNYSSNGGPPGWAMSLSRAVRQLQGLGLAFDDWKAAGQRSVRLLHRARSDGAPCTTPLQETEA